MSFLGEIKRRKVFQVAAVYSVVAWLLVQVITSISEPLSLPDWADTLVIVLLAIGFPIAVIFAWVFDLTADGIKATSDLQSNGVYPRAGGQQLTYLTHGLVVLAVGFLVVDQYLLEPRTAPTAVTSANSVAGTPTVKRFSHVLSVDQAFREFNRRMLAISPDGAQFVYNTMAGLYLRTMGELEARLIPGTEPSLGTITFSPDGLSVAYWSAPGELRRVRISGGVPVGLGPLETLLGISWQPDGSILYAGDDGIYRIPDTGGAFERVIPLEVPGVYGAELLPDGDSMLFSVTDTPDWDASEIVVQSLTTGERTVLIEGGNDARYLQTGHIVYALGETLFAVAFDAETLTVSGRPVPVVQNILRSTGGQSAVAHYDVSDNGTLIYVRGDVSTPTRTLVWVNREGREEPISAPPRNYVSPRLSPDGTKLAINPRDQELDIWTWDFARETLTRLTSDRAVEVFPLWSPDGQRIIFGSFQDGGSGSTTLSWQAANGSDAPERLAESAGEMFPTSFLPDSTAVLVQGDVAGADENVDIAVVQLNGSATMTPLLQSRFNERHAELSPDGRWIAYTSDESGTEEVYVRPFPEIDTGRWLISGSGGMQPLWSLNGRELFYRNGNELLAVPIESGQTFSHGDPEVLFEGEYDMPQGGRSYDVTRDGERFVMMRVVRDTSTISQIIVVDNWFEELKQLVPTE